MKVGLKDLALFAAVVDYRKRLRYCVGVMESAMKIRVKETRLITATRRESQPGAFHPSDAVAAQAERRSAESRERKRRTTQRQPANSEGRRPCRLETFSFETFLVPVVHPSKGRNDFESSPGGSFETWPLLSPSPKELCKYCLNYRTHRNIDGANKMETV